MTGIVGLKEALEGTACEAENLSNDQIIVLMMEKLSPKNYIPSTETELYESVFLREYKKFTGEPVPELPLENFEIKVLGSGCPNCDRLETVPSRADLKAFLKEAEKSIIISLNSHT